jgi:hypothetical protein
MASGGGLDQGGGAHRGASVPEEALTRAGYLQLRGPAGSWDGAAVAPPASNGNGTRSVDAPATKGLGPLETRVSDDHRCLGCGQPLEGRANQRWCGMACRARARRAQEAPTVVQEAPRPVAVDGDTIGRPAPRRAAETRFLPPAPPGGSPFDQLVAVASMLSPGWRLEATPSSVTVTWSA